MERRRAKALAHDADPTAERVRTEFHGWDLAQLRTEHDRLAGILQDAQADVSEALVAAGRRHDALNAQRRTWQERLASARRDAQSWNPRTRRAATPAVGRAQRELARIEQSVDGLEARMASLRGQWQSRRAYFDSHAAEVERFTLVRRAEQARELQVRTSARLNPPQAIVAVLGPEPDATTALQAW